MAYRDLGDFLARLEKNGQLKRINVPVSQDLEITEIADRVMKGNSAENVALLFENVRNHTSRMPVLIGMFGTEQRMAWALGVERLNELNDKLAAFISLDMPKGLIEKAQRGLEMLNGLKNTEPRYVNRADCQQVVMDKPSLSALPIIKCWPLDAGRYITLPSVFSRDPKTGKRNVGMYRLQVLDDQTLGMHWQRHKGGAEHQRVAQDVGTEKIPVAVALGGDPAITWAGSAPLPPDVDEIMLAGWLRGKSVDLVKCLTQPIEVPADSEIVIEGYVDPREQEIEGPFGDHTGYYSNADYYPVMHVTAITHRTDAIYPTTIVGKPPMEDVWMGKATERLFLPLMKLFQSEIVDVNMPAEGAFHNLVIVSIKKRYPGQARKVMFGIWGMGLMLLTKTIIVVDADVDVQNLSQVAFEVLANYDPLRDVQIVSGPTDDLDHASLEKNFGGKMGIDATRKTDRDPGPHQKWPPEIAMSPEIKALVSSRWKEYGF
ncbi:MAG: menaquinone biosynthesis decarboxylase [Chloroflexi bacterium]|nr:menaquinone biosynthesis decarboxylase [Chloroflexota bacterium]